MWYNAKVRDASVGVPVGGKVLVARSPIQHTTVGPCWLVFDGKTLRQVAESYGGREIYKIVTRGAVFRDQGLADRKIRPFLAKIPLKNPLF